MPIQISSQTHPIDYVVCHHHSFIGRSSYIQGQKLEDRITEDSRMDVDADVDVDLDV
jgi:hypothetical protein